MGIKTEQTQKILTGNYTFSQLGFSMLVTRLKRSYGNDSSPEALQKYTNEINSFLQKYGAVMSDDVKMISNL